MSDLQPGDRRPLFLPDGLEYPAERPAEWFDRPAPLGLEIGSGKGLFLQQQAARRPDMNWLGIEWSVKYAALAGEWLTRHDAVNACVLACDARRIVPRFPDAAFAEVHIYFPDPWWKRRHRKRRLFESWFVRQLGRVLAAGGAFHLATDVEEYFGVMRKVMDGARLFESWPMDGAAEADLPPLTNFERKYRREGRPIYRARYRRNADAAVVEPVAAFMKPRRPSAEARETNTDAMLTPAMALRARLAKKRQAEGSA